MVCVRIDVGVSADWGAVSMHDWIIESFFVVFSIRSVLDDMRRYTIRSIEIVGGIVCVLIARIILSPESIIYCCLAGAIAWASFCIIGYASLGKLGNGDALFSAFVAATFGFWIWDLGLLLATAFGTIWISILRISGRRPSIRDIRIPFVPFMFAGALAVSVYRGLSS